MLSDTEPREISVSELTSHIKAILEGTFPSICVAGEISDLVRAASGGNPRFFDAVFPRLQHRETVMDDPSHVGLAPDIRLIQGRCRPRWRNRSRQSSENQSGDRLPQVNPPRPPASLS